jgi:hypothetical protein
LKKKETALAIYEILLREIEIDNVKGGGGGLKNSRSSGNLNNKEYIPGRF